VSPKADEPKVQETPVPQTNVEEATTPISAPVAVDETPDPEASVDEVTSPAEGAEKKEKPKRQPEIVNSRAAALSGGSKSEQVR
jgi:hypothetical protein